MEWDSDESMKILKSYIAGHIDEEECFCLILSLEGYEQTRYKFLNNIDFLRLTQPLKFQKLSAIFTSYFKKEPSNNFTLPIGASVENGFLTSDFDYEVDMELAVSRSLTLGDASSSTKNECVQSVNINYDEKASTTKDSSNIFQKLENNINSDQEHGLDKNIMFPEYQQTNVSKNSSLGKSKLKSNKKKNLIKYEIGPERLLSSKPVIYWFRRDLRLHDNPALNAAVESGAPVIFTFLWTEKEEDPNNYLAVGGATKLWLHLALKCLCNDLVRKYGHGIIYRKTENTIVEMKRLIHETDAKTVVINNLYEPFLRDRDDKLDHVLSKMGVSYKRFDSYLLHEPSEISSDAIWHRGVGSVTHFMESCRISETKPVGHVLSAPGRCQKISTIPFRHKLDDLGLYKMPQRKDGSKVDWAFPIREQWDFGETGAWNALELFLEEGIRKYEKESSRADNLNTCRISPYLHFGQISPRAILRQAEHMKSPKFRRKLAWRDLSYWLLSLWPTLPSEPVRTHYKEQRWSYNKNHLKAWQKGYTGYPLIDAAMRQLWLTGWMNNYMRHVVASFLISYLHITWVEGYRWFQETLLDADVAINAMMWQNGGMSGLDQWNFVMHPVDAAMTCDPDGTYIRTWCPELQSLPDEFIHQPWKCAPSILRRNKVEIGKTYPHRIITDLEGAREQSLRDVSNVRRKYPNFIDARTGSDLVMLPNGKRIPCITRREFKYKTSQPDSKDNPHTAVLKGYRSRKRDEAIAFHNERDFMASTMEESRLRRERENRSQMLSSIF